MRRYNGQQRLRLQQAGQDSPPAEVIHARGGFTLQMVAEGRRHKHVKTDFFPYLQRIMQNINAKYFNQGNKCKFECF